MRLTDEDEKELISAANDVIKAADQYEKAEGQTAMLIYTGRLALATVRLTALLGKVMLRDAPRGS